MAGTQHEDDEMISGINVTPLVDITLVLLIIFMVTATYIVKETVEVELPRAAHGGETVQRTLSVIVTRDGELFVDGTKVDEAALVAKAQTAREVEHADLQAMIAADKAASHGAVMHVVDILKGAGVAKFAFEIERPQ